MEGKVVGSLRTSPSEGVNTGLECVSYYESTLFSKNEISHSVPFWLLSTV